MKKALRLPAVFLVLGTMLSGCIIWPGWYEDEGYHGGHHGGRGHDREEHWRGERGERR